MDTTKLHVTNINGIPHIPVAQVQQIIADIRSALVGGHNETNN